MKIILSPWIEIEMCFYYSLIFKKIPLLTQFRSHHFFISKLIFQGRSGQNNQGLLQSRMMNMNSIPGTNWKGGMGDLFSMPVGSISTLHLLFKNVFLHTIALYWFEGHDKEFQIGSVSNWKKKPEVSKFLPDFKKLVLKEKIVWILRKDLGIPCS